MESKVAKPWYVDLVKEIGGLGLVLVMLVGLFFIAKDFTNDMRQTWYDIRGMAAIANEQELQALSLTREIMNTMISQQTKEVESLRERVRRLEQANVE